jgi:putative DNA primase/helicase
MITQNVKAIERAIKNNEKCQVYRRGMFLVEPLYEKVRDDRTGNTYLQTWLRQLDVTQLGHLIQKHAVEFLRQDSKGNFRTADWTSARDELASLLNLQHQDLPKIRGIVNSPTMRSDGSIITEEGYDEATELWYRKADDLKLPPIPEEPTKEEALAALQLFDELLIECSFDTPIDKSVALAAILTVALRAAFKNAPHFKFDAPSPRSGKSYLCELIMMIAVGIVMMPTAGSLNKEEMEKRIETALVNGRLHLYLGNLPDGLHLSSPAPETIATEAMADIRKLGTMDEYRVDCCGVTMVFINGNNIILVGALVERTLNCRIDTKEEFPGKRVYKQRPKEMISADRGKYLAAAFTIARAYIAAECSDLEMTPFGGFDDWSKIVRAPLVWLGVPDPVETLEAGRALDPIK